VRRKLEEIHRAFPHKPIVISEYGYCACTPDRPENDLVRIRILREHDDPYRQYPFVGGAVFFCYNDYRTHMGDKGIGVLKQRVHGVVDVYGACKASFEALRQEASPVQALRLTAEGVFPDRNRGGAQQASRLHAGGLHAEMDCLRSRRPADGAT
jgi:beta-glucuronidase